MQAANCPATPREPRTFYVSTTGNDASNDGTMSRPFRTVQAGVDCVSVPSDRVYIYGGNYTEYVSVVLKNGAPGKRIVIEGEPGITFGPVATIDGSVTKLPHTTNTYNFHSPNNQEWVCASAQTPCKEYISKKPIPKPANLTEWFFNRAAFVEPVNGRYTRLILYSRLEDLQADNETFEVIREGPGVGCPPIDPRPGPTVGIVGGCTERRPWVYMGPGLWFDQATYHLHARLSPTHNNVRGLADYAGPTNPNDIGLAINEENMTTLAVRGSSHILVRNIGIRFGGESLRVENGSDVVFEGVEISAGQYGIRSGEMTGLRFSNCVVDGGLPTWLFRGDLKDGYSFRVGDQTLSDGLAARTVYVLALGNGNDHGTEFEHCEFANAHDLYLVGHDIKFHHNWINNLNDESLFLDAGSIANGVVHDNVITQGLTAISFAGSSTSGLWQIYRNLIDLRRQTAGYRPRNPSFNRAYVFRAGFPFKSNEGPPGPDGTSHSDGPFDLFQNTFVVAWQADHSASPPGYPQPLFSGFRPSQLPWHQRRSFNNIFVVMNRELDRDNPIAFMPPADFPAYMDGNLYYRRGYTLPPPRLFYTPVPNGFATFMCTVPDCLSLWRSTPFFNQSRSVHPPGFEANSLLLKDPQFSNWAGEDSPLDDLRLQVSSPARKGGIVLPPDLKALDTAAPGSGAPDIGVYQVPVGGTLAPKLRVGVRGRRVFPENGPG